MAINLAVNSSNYYCSISRSLYLTSCFLLLLLNFLLIGNHVRRARYRTNSSRANLKSIASQLAHILAGYFDDEIRLLI